MTILKKAKAYQKSLVEEYYKQGCPQGFWGDFS
jgi:hypothetical protein